MSEKDSISGGEHERRIDRVEERIDGLFAKLENKIEEVFRNIREIDRSRQMNWPVVLSGVGTMISLVVVAATLIVSHTGGLIAIEQAKREGFEQRIADQLEGTAKATELTVDRSIKNSERIAEIDKKLDEVETQFFWAGDAEAGERADNDRLVRMLWKREYGEDLPAKNIYERGPQRH